MNDQQFLKLLKELDKSEETSYEFVNAQIAKYIDLKTISTNKRTENFFNLLVEQKMANIQPKNIKNALTLLNTIFDKYYGSLKTLDRVFSEVVRKPLRTKYGEKSEYYKLSKKLAKISYEDKGALIKDEEEKREAKNRNLTEIDVEHVMQVIKGNIDSPDIFRQAITLLICVGSRPNEFFLHAKFEPSTKENYIVQNYLAKKGKNSETSSVEKPLIYISPKEFIKKVADIRTKFNTRYKSLTNDKGQLISSVSTQANKVIKEMFPEDKTATLYSARKYYGLIAHSLYAPNSNYVQFLKDVYQHKNANVSMSYSNFIPKKFTETKQQLAIKTVELENKLDNIEDRLGIDTSDKNIIQKIDGVKNKVDSLKIPKVAEIVVSKKERKKRDELLQVQKIYEEFKKEFKTIPSQNKLESLCVGIPRSSVREFYRQNVV